MHDLKITEDRPNDADFVEICKRANQYKDSMVNPQFTGDPSQFTNIFHVFASREMLLWGHFTFCSRRLRTRV